MSANESQPEQRRPFFVRHDGLITWVFWVASVALTVMVTLLWAPRDTVRDWWMIVAWLSAVTVFPLLVALAHHYFRLSRAGTWWSGWLLAALVACLLLGFGFQVADWSAAAGDGFRDGWDRLGSALLLAFPAGAGASMVALRFDGLRRRSG